MSLKKGCQLKRYSADLYSDDMKKYQFQAECFDLQDAYDRFIAESKDYGVSEVRCLAVYDGLIHERNVEAAPLRVWQNKQLMLRLVEA